MRGLVHSIRVYLRDPRIKTSWAACLDNQGTLESNRGSVFLRVSVLSRTLRLAMWPGTRTLIYLNLVGTQGVSEGEPQADQRGDVEPDNVGRFLSLIASHPCAPRPKYTNPTDPECWDV